MVGSGYNKNIPRRKFYKLFATLFSSFTSSNKQQFSTEGTQDAKWRSECVRSSGEECKDAEDVVLPLKDL